MANITNVTDSTFEREVIKSDRPAIVDFWAEWCMPCKMIAPVVDQAAEELDGKVKFLKMDIDDNTEIAADMGVMNIPTLIFFKDGKETGRVTGVVSKKDLLRKIGELFYD